MSTLLVRFAGHVRRAQVARLLALVLGGLLGLSVLIAVPATASADPVPANDDFANAQVLTGVPVTASGSNIGATKETGEPSPAGRPGENSVWYSWTSAEDGYAEADPAGSSFDTVIGVYTGSAVDDLTEVVSVDDAGGSEQGRAVFAVTAGTTYMVLIHGYEDASGAVELRMASSTAPTGTITGRVADVDDGGLDAMCVDAYAAEGDSVGQATTGGGGYYEITGLPVGDYRVAFSDCDNGAYATEFYYDAATYSDAEAVSVAADQETWGIDAQLDTVGTTGSISGHLVDRQGSDLGGVCVDAYLTEGVSAAQAVSDTSGSYRISGLEPGDYRVGFSDCGSGALPEFYDDAATYGQARPVAVTANAGTRDIDAAISLADDPATISGRVTDTGDNPLADICVTATLVDGSEAWQARTGSDGRYSVDVDAGDYTVNFFSCSLGYPIEEWYGGATVDDADTITATTGRETSGIDADMVIGGAISGTVTDDAGTPITNMCVDVFDTAGDRVGDVLLTGSAGGYRARDIVPGTYFVGFRNCRDVGPFADEFYEDASTLAQATPVVVTAGATSGADGVLDRVAPPDTVILTGPAEGSTIASSTATFTFAGDPAAGAVGFWCQIDSRFWASCADPKSYTNLSEGAHTFRVYAVDQFGFEDLTEATRSFRVDTRAPDTTVDSGPAEGSTITSASATFEFAGDPAGDTAKMQCKVDAAAYADCTSPATFNSLAEGSHTVLFRAEDAAGNQDASPASRTFTVAVPVTVPDTTAPDTVIDSGPADGATIDSTTATFDFHGTAGDTARVQCQLDSRPYADCTSPATFNSLAEGSHTVLFRAEDAAGNQDQSPASRTFTVSITVPDTTAPNTAIDSGPAKGATIRSRSATFVFHGTAGDTTKVQCKLDAGAFAGCASPRTFTGLTNGSHTVSFRAIDAAGNVDTTPATRTFTVRTSACTRATSALDAAEHKVDRAREHLQDAKRSGTKAKVKRAEQKLRSAKDRLRADRADKQEACS
jgi:Carboxypeptidase regulatory-like domain